MYHDDLPADIDARVVTCIRIELARRNLRAPALGDILDLASASVSRRMAGQTPFSVAELGRIAEAWSIPISRLLGESQPALVGAA